MCNILCAGVSEHEEGTFNILPILSLAAEDMLAYQFRISGTYSLFFLTLIFTVCLLSHGGV
jgi:hypothetical protein